MNKYFAKFQNFKTIKIVSQVNTLNDIRLMERTKYMGNGFQYK